MCTVTAEKCVMRSRSEDNRAKLCLVLQRL